MSTTPPAAGESPYEAQGSAPGSSADGAPNGERGGEPGSGGSEGEPELAGSEAAAGEAPKKPEEDPDLVLLHAETPVPSLDELRAALAWAFEKEDIPPAALDLYAQHAHTVLEGNRRMNLTAIVEPKEVAAKHYLDSWRATRLLPLLGRSILDIGTGAGFPGMPIALAEPQSRVVMLDSTKKRADFVNETIAALGMKNAKVAWERGELHLARNRYDLVMMRAISSVRENVRLLRKVKHSHKDLVMLKGSSWSREVRAAEREAERLGFRLDTVWEHELPGEMGGRAILVYRAPGGHGS
jgi:16S rRNA (guanine527-N7)-methyltransferase